MKQAIKHALAILLATLLVLGVSTAASAAAGPPKQRGAAAAFFQAAGGTATITTQPADTTFEIYSQDPNLSGMVLEVDGGAFAAPETIVYDDVANDFTLGPGKILWYFMVWPNDTEAWWQVGPNDATLYVSAAQCATFHVMEVADGVEYGYYDFDDVFSAEVPITVTGVVYDQFPYAAAAQLTLDVPATALIPATDPFTGNTSGVWFKFTAPADGHYRIQSDGGRFPEYWYDQDGNYRDFPPIDPFGTLYSQDGAFLDWDDDFAGSLNFLMFFSLKRGESVYLFAELYWFNEAPVSYTVTVTAYEPGTLALTETEITVNYHDYINLYELLEDMDYNNLRIKNSGGIVAQIAVDALVAIERGTATVTLQTDDGRTAALKVTVKYSFRQWLCVIFLGGWAWIKYTGFGPFDLRGEIQRLRDYGINYALYELFVYGWGWPAWLFSWLI